MYSCLSQECVGLFICRKVYMSYSQYEFMKQQWINNNPNATQEQYTKAMREIARLCGV